MIIKVCGMRETDNIRQISELDIDWIGLIFYPPSPRFFESTGRPEVVSDLLSALPRRPRLVGVFVNESVEKMMQTANRYKLDYLQLHGHESPDDCYALQKRGWAVIKAFSVATKEDLIQTEAYAGRADYFLFDTQCSGYGGSGQSFDWSLLASYRGLTPFLLSGGIRPESLASLSAFRHPQLAGIDLNSGFETRPGRKDPDKLNAFIRQIKASRSASIL